MVVYLVTMKKDNFPVVGGIRGTFEEAEDLSMKYFKEGHTDIRISLWGLSTYLSSSTWHYNGPNVHSTHIVGGR